MTPRRLRRGNPRPRYVLEVEPGTRLTAEQAEQLRAEFTAAMRSGRPIVTEGVTVRQFAPGMKQVWR